MNDVRCHDANLPLENSTRRGEGTRRNRVHNLRNIMSRAGQDLKAKPMAAGGLSATWPTSWNTFSCAA